MRASTFVFLKALLLCWLAALAPAAQAPVLAQVPGGSNHIAAELVAESAPVPGETLDVAFHFRPEPGWHGYWSNPGDAGYGMELDWELPEGWQAGEPQYPVPERLLISGLMNHVYEGDYAVLVPISVPENAAVANLAPIAVEANWLACTDEICVPEQARLTLSLPPPGTEREGRFDQWRAALPPLLDRQAAFALTPDTLRIAIPLPASLELADPHVFLADTQIVDYAAPQSFRRTDTALVAEIPRGGLMNEAEGVSGILKLDEAGNGVTFTATPGAIPSGGEPVASGAVASGLAPLFVLLGGALLGGLILNLMPCVFPILSLKAMTLARAGESEGGARREGMAYTAGVVLATLALGALLLALRAGGEQVGWAFQLQEPGVVVFLLVLAVAITANFAGLFELPSVSFTSKGGQSSAFATGLLAAFVATPCTGPFMAAAMGAALLLPWWQAMLLFAALGLGLALPFLLLGFVPALRKMLPRPGPWMDTFRRIMAVPMGLTALALLWLCWRLGGEVFALGSAALALALVAALFWLGRRQTRGASAGRIFAPVAIAIAALAVFVVPTTATEDGASAESLLDPQDYSAATLAEARASGQPVFLWFTADWCLTCKVNENVAIEREATKAAFEQAGVVAMRGDWTRRDPAITEFLTQQGAAGVPLYLWYPAGGDGEVLPQVLTPDSLVALAEGSGSAG